MGELVLPHRFAGTQYREASVEHVDPDEGTVLLKAVPYDVETALDRDLFETFSKRAFARAAKAPSRTKLWHLHNGPLIGHALDVEDRDDGVWIRAKFSNTPNAQEARELAHDGSLDQVSITFRPQPEYMRVLRKTDGLHVTHDRAALLGVALVPHGQYDSHAFVASVREIDADREQREREARMARVASLNH